MLSYPSVSWSGLAHLWLRVMPRFGCSFLVAASLILGLLFWWKKNSDVHNAKFQSLGESMSACVYHVFSMSRTPQYSPKKEHQWNIIDPRLCSKSFGRQGSWMRCLDAIFGKLRKTIDSAAQNDMVGAWEIVWKQRIPVLGSIDCFVSDGFGCVCLVPPAYSKA